MPFALRPPQSPRVRHTSHGLYFAGYLKRSGVPPLPDSMLLRIASDRPLLPAEETAITAEIYRIAAEIRTRFPRPLVYDPSPKEPWSVPEVSAAALGRIDLAQEALADYSAA